LTRRVAEPLALGNQVGSLFRPSTLIRGEHVFVVRSERNSAIVGVRNTVFRNHHVAAGASTRPNTLKGIVDEL
jgi:hypothetical protein